MGLISLVKDVIGGGASAVVNSLESSVWKEYFESGDMSNGVLMKRGERILVDGGRNRKADNNLISSGSGIDVQEGQCMILVENGRIVEFCAEPGRYTYDSSTQPSLYAGENKGLKALGKEILAQWSAGGQRFATQRVYFINMGEIINPPIRWGCGDIAFHHVQRYQATGSMLELDMSLRANGQCTIQITDPVKFYQMIGAQYTGNDGESIVRISNEGIMSNIKSGVVDHISSAIATLGYEQQIPYTAIKAKTKEIKEYLNTELNGEWAGLRGFGVANISFNGSPVPTDDNMKDLKEMQNAFNMSQNANAMNYDIQKGFSAGFRAAGENGTFSQAAQTGVFMGGAMGGMGGFGNIQSQPTPNQYQQPTQQAPVAMATAPADAWTCTCGESNTSKFCKGCGAKKPDENNAQEANGQTWTCACGSVNGITAKFCPECGAKKPTVKKFVCDKCGWTPKEGEKVRFCPECGDIFDDSDIVES